MRSNWLVWRSVTERPTSLSTVHHFVIEPLKGIGPVRFGMHKDEVSRAFTYVYTSFFKVPSSTVRSDDCKIVGVTAHYDDKRRVNFIELRRPRYATVTLELFGRDITQISVRALVDFLRSRGAKVEKDHYGYNFPDLGMSTYNSDLQSEDQPVECIGLGLMDENEGQAKGHGS